MTSRTERLAASTVARASAGRLRDLAPGLLLAAAGAAGGYLLHHWVPGVQPGTVAVALGALLANLNLVPDVAARGLVFASKKLLRLAVVLLGFALSLTQVAHLGGPALAVVLVTVAAAFFGTLLLGRLLKVASATSLLVATGFSICGASAIAAMEPLAKGKKDDTAVSVALVTLCGTLAIVVLPLLRHPLGLDAPVVFGQWVGASVHDVGQTVATANTVPGSLQSAVIVKLTRVILLAPLVLGVGLYLHRRRHDVGVSTAKRPPLVPLFVAGFIAAIALNSAFSLPTGFLDVAHRAQEILLAVALFALGTGIHWRVMRRAGGRPLLLGALAWLLVAAVSYAGVRLIT
ncbi:YeiH family protein [Cumulibacter manganitolerans]|uniref:YeiH family protein n=1 Tax=Cumulibacter manganitolerans TaxID=1884992 RepID=UPI0012957F35|nr:putative sulfate exporter family transporter [Cumulibacter manganitolerans]